MRINKAIPLTALITFFVSAFFYISFLSTYIHLQRTIIPTLETSPTKYEMIDPIIYEKYVAQMWKGNVFFIWTTNQTFLSRRVMRAFESLFYHHPNAKVTIYSNWMKDEYLYMFTNYITYLDTGQPDIYPVNYTRSKLSYNISVKTYVLEEMMKGTPLENYTHLAALNASQYRYSHESDLLRTILIYKYGGIYLDTDVITIRPLNRISNSLSISSTRPVLGFDDPIQVYSMAAILIFDKEHPFLWAVMQRMAREYIGDRWNVVAKSFEFVLADWQIWLPNMVFDPHATEPIRWQNNRIFLKNPNIETKLLGQISLESASTRSDLFYSYAEGFYQLVLHNAYTFHYHNKGHGASNIYPGSTLHKIMNQFCIFCGIDVSGPNDGVQVG